MDDSGMAGGQVPFIQRRHMAMVTKDMSIGQVLAIDRETIPIFLR